jgi:Aldo/keto reductase family
MPAGLLRPRPLGSTQMQVSALSLGSWRTYERLPAETAVAIVRAARDEGINFFDDARYDDETGTAPMPTGYSEVLFGELFRRAGVRRDEAVVTNKLWWEFWPEQSAAAELDASLQRMGFDHVDVIYANAPPPGMPVADLVAPVGGLVAAGKARAWGPVVPPRLRWRWPSRSPIRPSPACCSAPAARSRSGSTAPRSACWTVSVRLTSLTSGALGGPIPPRTMAAAGQVAAR